MAAPPFADGDVNQYILTGAQISAAISSCTAIEVLPARTFICASAPARVYNKATP
jgi:hypothetical protein